MKNLTKTVPASFSYNKISAVILGNIMLLFNFLIYLELVDFFNKRKHVALMLLFN